MAARRVLEWIRTFEGPAGFSDMFGYCLHLCEGQILSYQECMMTSSLLWLTMMSSCTHVSYT